MKYFFTALSYTFIFLLFFESCKKKEIKKSQSFVVRFEGKTIVMDSVLYALTYPDDLSWGQHTIIAKSKSMQGNLYLVFQNVKDTTIRGVYPASSDNTKSRVRAFNMYLKWGATLEENFYSDNFSSDFAITITDKKSFHITGSASGTITGGNPSVGVNPFSSISNIRNVPISIEFDTPFYNP